MAKRALTVREKDFELRKLYKSSPDPVQNLRGFREPLYDTEMVQAAPAAAVGVLRFFAIPVGQLNVAAVVKTAADTNLEQSQALGLGNEFMLWGFRMMINPASVVADYNLIMNRGVFSFFFGRQQPYLQVPIADIPTGTAPFMSIVGAAAVGQYISHGVQTESSFYKYTIDDKPLHIKSKQSFSVELSWPVVAINPTVNTWVRVEMIGVALKPL